MLADKIAEGYGKAEGFNCAEMILYGANEVYGLGLDEKALKLAGGFGGGLGVESTCGALCAGVMVLSHLLIETTAHNAKDLKRFEEDYLRGYEVEMGSILCEALKSSYRTLENGCMQVVVVAAEYLDEVIDRIQRRA